MIQKGIGEKGETLDSKGKQMYRNRVSALQSRIRKKLETNLHEEKHGEVNERIDEFIEVIKDVITLDQKGIIVSKLKKGK